MAHDQFPSTTVPAHQIASSDLIQRSPRFRSYQPHSAGALPRSDMSPIVLPSISEARHRSWAAPHSTSGRPSIDGPSSVDGIGGAWRAPHTPSSGRPSSDDPRYASPHAVNGFPPPSAAQQQGATYLPPLHSQADMRASVLSTSSARPFAHDERQPAPAAHPSYPPHPSQAYHEQYGGTAHDQYYYHSHRGYPHAPAPASAAAGYQPDYRQAYPQDYAQSAGDRPREAPRQRTSIACRYCRKRKIRCSGHQNAPGGKCQNCTRMNQECIFQPVSSSSSTAFIPISAVPGGVPPGTQLFGAYGQPLAPGSVPTQPQGPPPPHSYPPPHRPSYYHHAVQSPTDSYFGESRGDEHMSGRRRRRTPEERDEGYRLPPPRASGYSDDDSRRRSPAELSGGSSPGSFHYHRAADAMKHSPRSSGLPYPNVIAGDVHRSPIVGSGSSGSSTPGRQALPPNQGQNSKMSLSNLVEKTDIDRGMIDRLNRPREPLIMKRDPSN